MGLPEQITDRAIESLEEDRFGHDDFVDRLATMVRATETPANIALFGRWGSGKTGIGNRLQAALGGTPVSASSTSTPSSSRDCRLLRQFLIRIAEELGGPEARRRYRQAVYERRERVRLGRRDWLRSASGVNWASLWAPGPCGPHLAVRSPRPVRTYRKPAQRRPRLLGAVFPVLLPSALVAAAVAFGARHLSVTTVVEAPAYARSSSSGSFLVCLPSRGWATGPAASGSWSSSTSSTAVLRSRWRAP